VSLVKNGTRVLFNSQMSDCTTSELALSKEVLSALTEMLCLADRNFFGCEMWTMAKATPADMLWRVTRNARLQADDTFADGSYLSCIHASNTARHHKRDGVANRVINYTLDGVNGAEALYRLVRTILDPQGAPAHEFASVYHERL